MYIVQEHNQLVGIGCISAGRGWLCFGVDMAGERIVKEKEQK